MSRRRSHRKDTNHDEIAEALTAMGWLVEDVSQTNLGYDAIVTKGGRTERLEIKGGRWPSERVLTPNEAKKQAVLKRYGVDVLVIKKIEDLAQLDREARQVYEGIGPREYYPE